MKTFNHFKFLAVLAFVSASFSVFAQTNDKADNIIGRYSLTHGEDVSRVCITKNADGTYKCQVEWVEKDKDENGQKRLDVKNPDKALRSVPCDRIVLFDGLKYNATEKVWDGTKIYEPHRGVRAKVVCKFNKDGKFEVKGSLLGISETHYWDKL